MTKKERAQFSVKRSSAGLGLFAAAPFKKGDFVIEYTGEIIPNAEADRRANRYIFEISSRRSVDGSTRKNLARYINHSCRPNCEAEIDRSRIMIYAKRNIGVGEELHYHYGKAYFDDFIKPKGCQCAHCRMKK